MTGDHDADDPLPASPRRMLLVLLAFAVAILLVLLLVQRLQQAARMQDCIASGRTNCAPIEAPNH